MADPHTRVYRKGVLEAEGFPDVDASRIAVPTLIAGYYGMNAPYPGFGRTPVSSCRWCSS